MNRVFILSEEQTAAVFDALSKVADRNGNVNHALAQKALAFGFRAALPQPHINNLARAGELVPLEWKTSQEALAEKLDDGVLAAARMVKKWDGGQ